MNLPKQGGIFDSARLKDELHKLETRSQAPDFWDNREDAEKVLGDIKRIRGRIEPWEELDQQMEDMETLLEMIAEESEEEAGVLAQELQESLDAARDKFEQLKILELLNGPNDAGGAYVTIHSGAGGTEACDWTAMLYRMYVRWMERHEMKVSVLDLLEAEGGIKSVTVEVQGDYAYGYLKGETGVHRLVRISPFDSSGRRHTSFASVYVSPVLDDAIEFEVRPQDIRVDTYRAGGAGGQHVNKTDSAVRITHLETGIVVQCQNERSQHKNKDQAMKMLKSRLYDYYEAERDKERAKGAAEKKDISWGNQIRSYVFQPYTMVKDMRTRHESSNIQAVMDGALDPFIQALLKQSWDKE